MSEGDLSAAEIEPDDYPALYDAVATAYRFP